MPSARMYRQTSTITRQSRKQAKMGGTTYEDVTTNIAVSIDTSIQTAPPVEIENWAKRGVEIDTRIYTDDLIAMMARQGDLVSDETSTPVRKYTVMAPPQDMGARGEAFCLYCKVQL